jgi:signal transduction histidine kinase
MKKLLIILMALPLFLFEMPAVPMEAASAQGSDVTPVDISNGEKVLVAKLNKTKGSGRLVILDSLTELYWNVPREEYWLKRCYRESLSMDSLRLAEKTLLGLAVYYHNSNLLPQLLWCSAQEDVLAKKLKYFSDNYFSIKSYVCKRYLWNENYNEAISNAQHLLDLAIENRSEGGREIGEELMGDIYQLMKLNNQSLVHLGSAYKILVKIAPKDFRHIAQLTTTLIEVNLELNHLKDAYSLISSFEAIQADVESGKYGKQPGFPIDRNHRLASIYFANYYYRSGDLLKMQKCMERAAAIKHSDVYVDFLFDYESAKYNDAVKNYPEALSYINKVIEADGGSTVEYRNFRAGLYQKMGKLKEAVDEYKVCVDLFFKSRSSYFNKQVAGLQHFQDTKLIELRLKDKELRIKKMQNQELIVAVAFFLILSLVLGLFLNRNRRLGVALKKNNERLANEDELLKFALKKSNEADKLKTSFLHSVSHEVRTPLNAIVGFSNLIAEDDSYKKYDVKEFSKLISKNSNALLELMDKILKISQYETSVGNIDSKKISSCDVTNVCNASLDKLRKEGKLKPGVELVFKGVPEDYILNTNEEFLGQMLYNLLDNAAKNTETGSITLAYELSGNSKSVVFSITDTGKGIEESKRNKIFDEFEKGDSFAQGLGLGLVMCKIIASNLGGKIELDDLYRDGCKFIFTHPTDLKTRYEKN